MRDWTVRQVAVAVVGRGARYHRGAILDTHTQRRKKEEEDFRIMRTTVQREQQRVEKRRSELRRQKDRATR